MYIYEYYAWLYMNKTMHNIAVSVRKNNLGEGYVI